MKKTYIRENLEVYFMILNMMVALGMIYVLLQGDSVFHNVWLDAILFVLSILGIFKALFDIYHLKHKAK